MFEHTLTVPRGVPVSSQSHREDDHDCHFLAKLARAAFESHATTAGRSVRTNAVRRRGATSRVSVSQRGGTAVLVQIQP